MNFKVLSIYFLYRRERFIYKYVILRNMEIISRISRGSKMDQIYISKNRSGLELGSYVVITPVLKKQAVNPYYHNIKSLEPIKVHIINEIFRFLSDSENVIITGSFVEKGFNFNEIDLIIINGAKSNIEEFIRERFGMEAHVIDITYKALRKGINTDPLFQMMLSRFAAKKRTLIKIETKINYKLLDIYLLKSKLLMDNFDCLNGKEKYKMIRNVFAIKHFLKSKELSKENIDRDINGYFGKNTVKEITDNTLEKQSFIKKYKILYDELFERIMEGVKHGAEQE